MLRGVEGFENERQRDGMSALDLCGNCATKLVNRMGHIHSSRRHRN